MERDLQDRVGYQIGVVAHLMHNQFNQKLSEYGVTHAQFKVLYQLNEHVELLQSELQNKLYIKASTMNGIIESMLKNQLIEKKDSTEDRRAKKISLTLKGKQLENTLWHEIGQLDKETMSVFTNEEKQFFLSCLLKMISHYQK
ncbi:MarR family winged helix-turn-helix transcriptional regulator [Halalkalibacter alkalisediminis]|uniref:MarR family winged helix-turn-helix transcriptional regulator n=1 Tax=Halalkalibacter alkalisediminis TaxID=935616 RepID=A0ABV6NGA0_9BACI|nr:MarR family transcriptional regulator [Halalkalibacter alkalisediminis]